MIEAAMSGEHPIELRLGGHPVNAYDILAEIGTKSVQRDTRRFVAGRGIAPARQMEVENIRLPGRHRLGWCGLTIVIAATWAAIGSASARVCRRTRGATGPDTASAWAAPSGGFGATRGDGQTEH